MAGTTIGTGNLFALTPGKVNTGDIIQMDTKLGGCVYNKAIQPPKVSFEEDSKIIHMFQSQLQGRIEMCGWDTDSGDIIRIKDHVGDTRNFVTYYGYLITKTM